MKVERLAIQQQQARTKPTPNCPLLASWDFKGFVKFWRRWICAMLSFFFFLVRINNNLFNVRNRSLDASLTTWYSESNMLITVREYKFSGNIFYCMYYLRPLCTASHCFSFIHRALNFIRLGSTVFSAISSGTGHNIIWGPSWSKLFVFIFSSFSILCKCPSITSQKFNLCLASGQEKRLLRFAFCEGRITNYF